MRKTKPAEPRKVWSSPVADYDHVTVDACKFIFEQSRQYLEETITESTELTNKSSRMLFLLLPAIVGVIGYVIIHDEKFRQLSNFCLLLLLLLGGTFVNSLYYLFKLISPKEAHYRGVKPEDVMRPEIFQLRNYAIEKALYISEIERCQIKIEEMEYWNFQRIQMYIEVVISFCIGLAIGTILLILSI